MITSGTVGAANKRLAMGRMERLLRQHFSDKAVDHLLQTTRGMDFSARLWLLDEFLKPFPEPKPNPVQRLTDGRGDGGW